MSRGNFLRCQEETVTINGCNLTDYQQKIIVMESRRPKVDPQGYVTQELYYIGNIYPANCDIYINDEITRKPLTCESPRGASSGYIQVLTVEDIRIVCIRGQTKQQLILRDRDRPVR